MVTAYQEKNYLGTFVSMLQTFINVHCLLYMPFKAELLRNEVLLSNVLRY